MKDFFEFRKNISEAWKITDKEADWLMPRASMSSYRGNMPSGGYVIPYTEAQLKTMIRQVRALHKKSNVSVTDKKKWGKIADDLQQIIDEWIDEDWIQHADSHQEYLDDPEQGGKAAVREFQKKQKAFDKKINNWKDAAEMLMLEIEVM